MGPATPDPSLAGARNDRLVKYLGLVNYATIDHVLEEIRKKMCDAPGESITLIATSAGGSSGTAMGFYNAVRLVLKPVPTTIVRAMSTPPNLSSSLLVLCAS